MVRQLSPRQIKRAGVLYRKFGSWKRVAKEMGIRADDVRKQAAPHTPTAIRVERHVWRTTKERPYAGRKEWRWIQAHMPAARIRHKIFGQEDTEELWGSIRHKEEPDAKARSEEDLTYNLHSKRDYNWEIIGGTIEWVHRP
jgi:hypothetical protein